MTSQDRTPREEGYRMPAEWETHSATQLHWPSNRETWPGGRLRKAERVFLEIIRVLHRYEPVILLVDISVSRQYVIRELRKNGVDLSRIKLCPVYLNDVWARDCGPVFVKNYREQVAIIDWEYNAWGEKYPPFHHDNNLPGWFSEQTGIPRYTPGMVLEGGSIDTNGNGVFLTTESVLLNKNRNPEMTKKEIEKNLRDYLGAEQVIWLKKGLAGDDTDGHVDDLARFLDEKTILTMVCEDPHDINYEALQINYRILKQARNRNGNPFTILSLPLPQTRIEGTTVDGSEYVPASYANFYIANGVVLVPLYDEQYDEQALTLFKERFPGREVVGIECGDLVWGQGSIHCITQQLYGPVVQAMDSDYSVSK